MDELGEPPSRSVSIPVEKSHAFSLPEADYLLVISGAESGKLTSLEWLSKAIALKVAQDMAVAPKRGVVFSWVLIVSAALLIITMVFGIWKHLATEPFRLIWVISAVFSVISSLGFFIGELSLVPLDMKSEWKTVRALSTLVNAVLLYALAVGL